MNLPQFSLIATQTWVTPYQLSEAYANRVWGAGLTGSDMDDLIERLHHEATHPAQIAEQWDELRAMERMHDD